MSSEKASHILINDLDPEKKPWTIKVRVIRRGNTESYETRYGFLDIMKLILMDEEGTKIQAILKNQQISRLGATMEKDKTFFIENGTINAVDTDFANAHNKFEIVLAASTNVYECTDVFLMPTRVYNFLDCEKLEQAKVEAKDIIGVVVKVQEPRMLKTGRKTKRDTIKRDITLFDGRSTTITVGLWADLANNEGELLAQKLLDNPIVVISNVRSSWYQGEFNLSTTQISTIEIDPETTQTKELRNCYKKYSEGKNIVQLLQPSKRMRDAVEADLKSIITGSLDVSFCTFKAKIDRVLNRDHPWYENCKNCHGRVYPESIDDTALCSQCENKHVAFSRHPMLRLRVSDGAHEACVTIFDALETILGCTLYQYVEEIKKCESKDECIYYKKLFTCLGKEYIFLVKLDPKNALDRSRKNIIAQEIKSNDDPGSPLCDDTNNHRKEKKKMKIEK